MTTLYIIEEIYCDAEGDDHAKLFNDFVYLNYKDAAKVLSHEINKTNNRLKEDSKSYKKSYDDPMSYIFCEKTTNHWQDHKGNAMYISKLNLIKEL